MGTAQDFTAFNDGHVRLNVLRLLHKTPNYTANSAVLQLAVDAMGLACTHDQMRGHLAWLGEQRLVALLNTNTQAGLVVATLTERGDDVGQGRSVIAGVQRPAAE